MRPANPDNPQGIQAQRPLSPWEQPGCFRRDCQPHRGRLLSRMAAASLVLTLLGVAVLGFPLGLTTWILAQRDLAGMRQGRLDPSGEWLTRGALEQSATAWVLSLIVNGLLGMFLVATLFLSRLGLL